MPKKDPEDYDVQATWIIPPEMGPGSETVEETIGSVTLAEDATWQEMPDELEINGFTYLIER